MEAKDVIGEGDLSQREGRWVVGTVDARQTGRGEALASESWRANPDLCLGIDLLCLTD